MLMVDYIFKEAKQKGLNVDIIQNTNYSYDIWVFKGTDVKFYKCDIEDINELISATLNFIISYKG